MASLKFVLDVFVKSFKAPKLKAKYVDRVEFDVKFNSMKIEVTKSRINVTDFSPKSGLEFESKVENLRKNVEDNGVVVKAMLQGRSIGEGKIDLPEKFVDGIHEDMADLEHEGTCTLEKSDEEVGAATIKLRLIIKCENTDKNAEEHICRRNMNINATDIMFVLADPQPCGQPPEICADELEPEEGDGRLELDLDRYKPIKKQEPQAPKETDEVPASLPLKNLTEQYGHVIDSLVAHTNKLNSPMPDDQTIIDWSGKPAPPKPKGKEQTIRVPVEDWDENGIKPIRFCPVCLTAMSWMPKLASCPKCCAKPQLDMKQMVDKQPTADEIVEQYLKLPPKDEDPCKTSCEREIEKRCGCVCKKGKMCLHCRMRVINADLFQKKISSDDECPAVKPTSKEDFCVVVDGKKSKCSPHLEKVFAELNELYTKKD
ncbi:hypothetical protein KR093_005103, partial [Drosophila rubida]